MKLLLLFVAVLGHAAAIEWTHFSTTWLAYNDQPRTTAELTEEWEQLPGDNLCDGSGLFYGTRYLKNGDRSLIIVFDANGYVAGTQMSVEPSESIAQGNEFPFDTSPYYKLEVIDGVNWYTTTAYFVEPERVCSGRTEEEFNAEGTGTGLHLLQGDGLFVVPNDETEVEDTGFDLGLCFISMGVHYWYDYINDPEMDCKTFMNVFLLYNGGVLKGFGWANQGYFDSPNVEHPEGAVIGAFMDPVPTCLPIIADTIGLTTQHIYFRNPYLEMFC